MQSQAPVLLDMGDAVARIRFNRPERLNALDVEVALAFEQCVDRALADASVRVVVVSSEGRAFMAGGDLRHFRDAADKSAAALQLLQPLHSALKKLAASQVISLGSLNGAVAGGGMSIALGLDLVLAAADTTFNLAYSRLGASPDCGGSWSLPRLVGYRRALEIALLSDSIDAQEASRLGLVNRVVALSELQPATHALALRLAAGAPLALARTKALMRDALERSYASQLDLEMASFAECAGTADFSEALSAFFEKRSPRFGG